MSDLLKDLQALLAVQAVDSLIDRAKAALAALDTGASTAAAYNAAKAEADTLRAQATKAQAGQHDTEMRLQSIEEKTKQVQKTLFSGAVTGPRELENLQREIEMLGRQKGDNEEKVLEAMESASAAVAAAEKAEAGATALADKYRKTRTAYKERHAALSAEVAAHEKERADAARPVPPALLTRYDAIRARKGGLGAAPMNLDGTCGACHTRMNTGLDDDVRAGKAYQVCEYCGRLLVPMTRPPAS